MGLFDKKYCDICGDKIRLLGNKKLEDGNMCKNCANKLSPWFEDRRRSTVMEIKEQLAYREENKEKVKVFKTSYKQGENTVVFIDEEAHTFMVSPEGDLLEMNPDVLDFKDVKDCFLDIEEIKTEIMREDKDGKEVSYPIRRYEYSYNFEVVIEVEHPYFNEIRFKLNLFEVDGQSRREYDEYKEMGEEICEILAP